MSLYEGCDSTQLKAMNRSREITAFLRSQKNNKATLNAEKKGKKRKEKEARKQSKQGFSIFT